ncbi:M4 family metallopeptidase [Microbacterium terricola]|uniref:Neutral metalloproteinase n=1 Tax=Microbacterium terricola TaxID=344163 RepID=A0ABM8DWV8_9MICO|nr:M4 family metallopeptidase [Microbacterium terricola]UYK39168.1 M4 family metallopeptidase [Microbacterium terricola]BDV30114.1 metalloprotease [Microbacterium terricola]
MRPSTFHAIVPPYLLARIATAGDPQFARAAEAARSTLAASRGFRPVRSQLRLSIDETGALIAETAPAPDRTISDAHNEEKLPGDIVRTEDDPATGDAAVDEAFDGLGATFEFFWDAYALNSVDGDGEPLLATVHYGDDYDNAFWNGERMVFGDGDGEVFSGFTRSLTVIAHELTHAVTEHAGGLVYHGQSGALNESVSDVFGALAEQHHLGQTADAATWLIGEGVFTPAVQGVALRSMKAPGTAYDDDVLGRDPQPAHMDDFVHTIDDNGGVHINSGIPNHAFYLAATALGGSAWERAGLIWYRTVTGGTLSSTASFAQFAVATVTAAAAQFGDDSAEAAAVRDAWRAVGVLAAESPSA